MPQSDFNRWYRQFGEAPASSDAPGTPFPARSEETRREAISNPDAPLDLPGEFFHGPPRLMAVNHKEHLPVFFRWLLLAGTGTGFLLAWALITLGLH